MGTVEQADPIRVSKKNKAHDRRTLLCVLPMAVFTVLFVVLPLLYMILLSFMTRAQVWGFEATLTLENYAKILEPINLKTFSQSLKLAFLSTICNMILGYPFGYLMGKLEERWKRRVMMLIMIPFWTSSLIRLYGWIIIFRSNGVLDMILMGLGVTNDPLKLLYTYPAVAVGMIYALLPMMILSVFSSVDRMDWGLVEAARDMGAGKVKAFVTVTLPLTMPGLFSGVILTFIPSMGLFFIADILGGNKIVLVGSLIQEQLTKGRNLPFAAALSVVLLVLTSLLIWIYRKVFQTGELEGMV